MMKKALDYLGIDLPDVVYNPKYQQILRDYPDIDLDNLEGSNYQRLLTIAEQSQFPELAQYLFSHTNPVAHQDEDYKEFQISFHIQQKFLLRIHN